MTVRLAADGTILFEGACPVEEAEPLRQLLLQDPAAGVDWHGCDQAHTAIFQVLLAARPRVTGVPGAAFLQDWMLPILSRSRA